MPSHPSSFVDAPGLRLLCAERLLISSQQTMTSELRDLALSGEIDDLLCGPLFLLQAFGLVDIFANIKCLQKYDGDPIRYMSDSLFARPKPDVENVSLSSPFLSTFESLHGYLDDYGALDSCPLSISSAESLPPLSPPTDPVSPKPPSHLPFIDGTRLKLQANGSLSPWVFRALCDDTTPVAVKFFELEHFDLDRWRDMNQALLLAQEHPGVVKLLGTSHIAGRPFPNCLVMELCASSLRQHLKQHPPADPSEKRRLAIQIAEALAFIHHCNIVHRAISTDHVLIDATGQIKIGGLDHAFSKSQRTVSASFWDLGGGGAAELAYLAPECYGAGSVLTECAAPPRAADVYSLGVVLWEIATCQRPFQGLSDEAIYQTIIGSTNAAATSHLSLDATDPFAGPVRLCLRATYDQRPSASHIAELLRGDIRDYSVMETGKLQSSALLQIQELEPSLVQFGALLGQGGFGRVYAGSFLGTQVAIKILMTSADTAITAVGLGERDSLAQAQHKNTVRLYGTCVHPSPPTKQPAFCFVMEYMGGGNLSSYLKDPTNVITHADAMRFAIDITTAVAHLHHSGLVHRDIKSANVLLDRDAREAKLSDFGLAILREQCIYTRVGTARWLAPELFMGGRHSKASDVWALGMVLWELYARKVPFDSMRNDLAIGVFLGMKKREVIPESCPFSALITMCWAQAPEDRPSADEILYILSMIEIDDSTTITKAPPMPDIVHFIPNVAHITSETEQALGTRPWRESTILLRPDFLTACNIKIGRTGSLEKGFYGSRQPVIRRKIASADLPKMCPTREILMANPHPNVVVFLGVIPSPPQLVMMDLGSQTLLSILHPSMPIQRQCQLAKEMADGLAHIHSLRLTHGGVRSSNIHMMNGHPVLGDLALPLSCDEEGRLLGWDLPATLAQPNSRAAPHLLPPEPVYSEASDVWSLGAVFYELANGGAAFSDLDTLDAARSLIRSNQHYKLLNPDHVLTVVIREMWHSNPDARPTAVLVRDHLEIICSRFPLQ